MAQSSQFDESLRPENFIHRLRSQLGSQALWDSLLIVVPPALGLFYAIFLFERLAWIGPFVALTATVVVVGFGILGVMLRYRPLIPKLAAAAQLVDARSEAKDHFLTLATIDPALAPAPLLARLRRETAEFVCRVELKRDFPYKPKRAVYCSIGSSLVAALLLQFLLPAIEPVGRPPLAAQRLRELAEKMAQMARLRELSQELNALAAKLEDPKIQADEKEAALHELEKKIDQQQKQEEEKDHRAVLGQTASVLKGAEQQQSANGQEEQKDHQKGGGNLQSQLLQEGQGEGKQSSAGGNDGKGEMSAQLNKEMPQGNSAQGNSQEVGRDKNQQQPGKTKDNSSPSQQDPAQSKNKMDKNQGSAKEGAGKNQASEEPPQGAPPTDRFYKVGEGKDGLKNARYVTVQLPEEVAAGAAGESAVSKESKAGRARTQVPVSNVPLPAHRPNAPSEKQQMPIEYRGIIR